MQEKRALIALSAFAVLGLAVLGYKDYFARPKLKIISMDYESAVKEKRLVNINTADINTIETLPGVGPKLAKDIMDYRAAHGSFLFKEDLKKVRGIGPKKCEEIKEYILLE
jgi:comEA protein